jgi:CHAT domain-containing protein
MTPCSLSKLALCAAVLVASPSSFCAAASAENSLTYLETAGRYADLQAEAEHRLSSGQKASATLLSYLCIAYSRLKQYEKLFDCTDKLDEETRRGDVEMALDSKWMFVASSDARPMPEVLRSRAYFELGEYAKAIASGNQALKELGDIPNTGGLSLYPKVRYEIMALAVIGVSSVQIGDLQMAKSIETQLEKISLPMLGLRMWLWTKNAAITQVYMAMGEYNEALKHIPDTLPAVMSLMISGLGPYAYRGDDVNTILDIPNQLMRGKALSETGRKSEAKALFDKILASPRIRDVGDLYWLALFERGRIAETESNPEQAAAFYRKAVDVVELQRSSVTTEASKIGFVGDKQVLYARLIAALIAQGHTAEAFDYIERSKSRALVDMLASKKDFSLPVGDSTQIGELLAKVEKAEMEAPNTASALRAQTRDSATLPSAAVADQRDLGISSARQAAAAIPPEVASLVSVSSTPIQEIQARIPTDEVLIEYYYNDKSLFIFLLSQKGLQMVRGDVGSLIADAAAMREASETRDSDAYLIPAQRLYRQLVLPIEPLLDGRSKLIIVPQGVLHYVPFAALHDGQGFLIDKYAYRELPSASGMKYLRGKHAPKAGGILAFGNPDLGDPRYNLKFAEEEARAIVQTIPASRLFVRQEATEAALRDNAAAFTYLHFATHGQFNADHPLDSALILAKDVSSDGHLTVSKLYSMHLDVDLAMLSACETGLGKIANGDDVVGLTRGFLFAGASTVVASLWRVDDKATSALMTLFYEKLKDKDKREALREAQIATRQTFPHPHFWAAFQLTGDAI